MTSFEMRTDTMKKRFPRLFLTARGDVLPAMDRITLTWPGGHPQRVVDISESGVILSAVGLVSTLRAGTTVPVRIRMDDKEPIMLSVKVLRVTAGHLFLAFESLTLDGRLRMGQDDRESLITSAWRRLPTQSLHPSFYNCEWWHSAFDSNIWIWRNEAGSAEKIIVEFESVAMVFDTFSTRFLKTQAALDEARGYVGPLTDPLPNKVEPGHNWVHRLQKVLGPALPESVKADVLPLLRHQLPREIHV